MSSPRQFYFNAEDQILSHSRQDQLDLVYQAIVQQRDADAISADQYDARGFTLLHWAAYCGQLADCKDLVERGLDVNAQSKKLTSVCNPDGYFEQNGEPIEDFLFTPLHLAAKKNHAAIADLLVKMHANTAHVYKQFHVGYTEVGPIWSTSSRNNPLQIANDLGNLATAKVLLLPTILSAINKYIKDRKEKTSYTNALFGTGYDKATKIKAAEALKGFLLTTPISSIHDQLETLEMYAEKHPEVKNKDLGKIYQLMLETISQFTILTALNFYLRKRESGSTYLYPLIRFGYNKASKLEAAEGLRNLLLEQPLSAQQGPDSPLREFVKNHPAVKDMRLGKIFSLLSNPSYRADRLVTGIGENPVAEISVRDESRIALRG